MIVCPKCESEEVDILYVDVNEPVYELDDDIDNKLFFKGINNKLEHRHRFQKEFLGCHCDRCGYNWIIPCLNEY